MSSEWSGDGVDIGVDGRRQVMSPPAVTYSAKVLSSLESNKHKSPLRIRRVNPIDNKDNHTHKNIGACGQILAINAYGYILSTPRTEAYRKSLSSIWSSLDAITKL